MSQAVSQAEPSTAANPSLGHRLSLYPTQYLVAMAMVSVGPLLDPMMREFGVPLSRGGLVSAGMFLGNITAIITLNTVLARVPTKATLFGGMALQGVALALAGLVSWDLWSLFVMYALVGFSGALMNATCWMWISAHMHQDRAGAALRMVMFFALAMMSVPLFIGVALGAGATWRWILAAEGALSLVGAAGLVFLPLLDVCDRQNVRLAQFRQVFAFDHRLLLAMMAAGFFYVGAETTMNVWLPKFQIDIFGASDTWASLSVTLFWVGLIAGRMTAMVLTTRFAPSRLLLVCACTFAVFAVAVGLAPTQVASLILAVGAGLGASASYGLIGSYAGRFPAWQSAVASSLFILCGSIGGIAFPYLMGPLASGAGFRVALALVAVPACAYAAISLLIHARAREG